MSCTPTSWSAEESKAKIAAAYRRKSDMGIPINYSRFGNDFSKAHRTKSDLSMAMRESPLSRTSTEEEPEYVASLQVSSRSTELSHALEMRRTVSPDHPQELYQSISKKPVIEVTPPHSEDGYGFEPHTKGSHLYIPTDPRMLFLRPPAIMLPMQQQFVTSAPTLPQKSSKRWWFGKRNSVTVH
ncbi:hypothetical protein K432DRAFT_129469 [Lepidopterella palustris CBS 459.81]|uniref:Uncharacterized protein n=1 Tax=Lepidopterella palustris CBS 459.81 TaxID=1314670 RepID=A0A8E2JC27_9PEZI|nr:hypothetical protein K432DRAFT_129469 [Lepidopterella palustris CBS 459.81]